MTSSVRSFLVNVVGLPLASPPEGKDNRRRLSTSSTGSGYGHLVRLDFDGNPSFVKYKKTQKLQVSMASAANAK